MRVAPRFAAQAYCLELVSAPAKQMRFRFGALVSKVAPPSVVLDGDRSGDTLGALSD